MKNDSGFTLLETALTLALVVILIGMSVMYLLPYNERNQAVQVKSEAQSALDISSSYLLSTSNYQKMALSSKLEKVLPQYSTDVDSKNRYEIVETKDVDGKLLDLTVYLYVIINDGLKIEAKIDPKNQTMVLKGIGKKSSIDSLKDSGVLDI